MKVSLVRRGRNTHDADDLVQEAWVRLADYQRLQPVERPDAFLMRTALNLSIDKHRMQSNHGEEVAVEDVVLIDACPDAEAVLLGRERMARLSECLARLSDRTREVFVAHRVDGLSYREVAQRYGLAISTVEKHVAKATLQLTSWMEGW